MGEKRTNGLRYAYAKLVVSQKTSSQFDRAKKTLFQSD
jgi:hypothetical protein